MRIADYPGNAGQGSYFGGSTLGVAAGDEDPGVGVFAMSTANGGSRILIGGRRHRAGVQHHKISLGCRCGVLQAFLLELAFDCGAVSLRSTTTKALQKKALRK